MKGLEFLLDTFDLCMLNDLLLEGKLLHVHLCSNNALICLANALPYFLSCGILKQCFPNGHNIVFSLCPDFFFAFKFGSSFRQYCFSFY